MKQRLTKKDDFHNLPSVKQYELLHETQLRVQRLERIVEGLLFWKEGSSPYEDVVAGYNEYAEEDKS